MCVFIQRPAGIMYEANEIREPFMLSIQNGQADIQHLDLTAVASGMKLGHGLVVQYPFGLEILLNRKVSDSHIGSRIRHLERCRVDLHQTRAGFLNGLCIFKPTVWTQCRLGIQFNGRALDDFRYC